MRLAIWLKKRLFLVEIVKIPVVDLGSVYLFLEFVLYLRCGRILRGRGLWIKSGTFLADNGFLVVCTFDFQFCCCFCCPCFLRKFRWIFWRTAVDSGNYPWNNEGFGKRFHEIKEENVRKYGKVFRNKLPGVEIICLSDPADVEKLFWSDPKHPERLDFPSLNFHREKRKKFLVFSLPLVRNSTSYEASWAKECFDWKMRVFLKMPKRLNRRDGCETKILLWLKQ